MADQAVFSFERTRISEPVRSRRNAMTPLEERFWTKVRVSDGVCVPGGTAVSAPTKKRSAARVVGGTLAVNWGAYGGFYAARFNAPLVGCRWRVCFGWVAVTYWHGDLDNLLRGLVDELDRLDPRAPGGSVTEEAPE